MFWLILYGVSILLNLFVFVPLFFKYIDRQQINVGDVHSIVAVSFFSLLIPVFFVCVIISKRFPLHLVYRFSYFLNNLWKL